MSYDDAMRSIDHALQDACLPAFYLKASATAPTAVLKTIARYQILAINAEIMRRGKTLEAQKAQEDARRRQSEQVKGKVTADFRDCLLRMSRELAVLSDEPALIIVQAAEGSCAKERGALWDSAQADGADPDNVVDYAEKVYAPSALAEVIAARAGAHGAEIAAATDAGTTA